MISFNLIILGVLLLASFLDLKYRKIPSIILTGALFVALLIYPQNLIYGVAGLVLALLLGELQEKEEWGMADIKVVSLIGLMVASRLWFFAYIIIFLVFQFFYTVVWRKFSKDNSLMPFIPCLTSVYIILLLARGLA